MYWLLLLNEKALVPDGPLSGKCIVSNPIAHKMAIFIGTLHIVTVRLHIYRIFLSSAKSLPMHFHRFLFLMTLLFVNFYILIFLPSSCYNINLAFLGKEYGIIIFIECCKIDIHSFIDARSL